MKLKVYILRDKAFFPTVYLMVGDNLKLVNEYWKIKLGKPDFKFSIDPSDFGFRTELEFNNSTARILWLRNKPKTIFEDSLLVHEIDHLASDILRDKGMKWSTANDEIHAYYSSFWYRKIFSKIKE